MIPLSAIMRDYVTIIRDYFTDYFTDFFTDYTQLFYRLYAIISWRLHPENGNVQTAILQPITKK